MEIEWDSPLTQPIVDRKGRGDNRPIARIGRKRTGGRGVLKKSRDILDALNIDIVYYCMAIVEVKFIIKMVRVGHCNCQCDDCEHEEYFESAHGHLLVKQGYHQIIFFSNLR